MRLNVTLYVPYIACLLLFDVWLMEDSLIFMNGKGAILGVDC
jgi:hypothetical protein